MLPPPDTLHKFGNFKSFFPDFFASDNEELFHDYSTQSYDENVNTQDEDIS